MLSPWLVPFLRLNGGFPPRWSVVFSPALGYSGGFAHLCSTDCFHTLPQPLLLLAGWEQANRYSSSSSSISGGVAPHSTAHTPVWGVISAATRTYNKTVLHDGCCAFRPIVIVAKSCNHNYGISHVMQTVTKRLQSRLIQRKRRHLLHILISSYSYNLI